MHQVWRAKTITSILASAILPIAALTLTAAVQTSGAKLAPDAIAASDLENRTHLILLHHCVVCHTVQGAAPFSLVIALQARRKSQLIAEVTASGYMPPWLPSGGDVTFENDRTLSPHDIRTLHDWSTENHVPSLMAAHKLHSNGKQKTAPNQQKLPSVYVLKAPQTYTVPSEGTDTYRCFVLPKPVPSVNGWTNIQINVENPSSVKHAALFLDNSGIARKLQSQSGGVGYTARRGGLPITAPRIAEWSPDHAVTRFPRNLGWQIDRNADLVLEMAYEPLGHTVQNRPEVTLQRSAAPVTIPVQFSLGVSEFSMRPDQTARVTDHIVLPANAVIANISPHLHPVCRSVELTARLPTGKTLHLLSIKKWSSLWQEVYVPAKPMILPKGTEISLAIDADNTRSNTTMPYVQNMEVIPGLNWMEEMAEVTLEMVAKNPTGNQKLTEESARTHTAVITDSLSKQHG